MKPGRAAAVLLLLLTGCNLFATPGQHARAFFVGLVEAPVPVQPDLSDGLAARVALDYLRALHRQGVALDYRVTETKRASGAKTIARLQVELPRRSDLAYATPATAAPRLGVELEPGNDGGWRVVRWWADD